MTTVKVMEGVWTAVWKNNGYEFYKWDGKCVGWVACRKNTSMKKLGEYYEGLIS